MADDDLFDYMFLDAQEKEEENELLREENEHLKEQLKNKEDNPPREERVSFNDVKDFQGNVQSIAADCWVDMQISFEEAEIAINEWYTPEDYYEYKMSN